MLELPLLDDIYISWARLRRYAAKLVALVLERAASLPEAFAFSVLAGGLGLYTNSLNTNTEY